MKNWFIFVLLGFCSMSFAEEADLVLRNGTVITMDEAMPEASAVAVKGDRIIWAGKGSDVEKWIGKNTKVLDVHGGFVYPGLIESHAHIVGLGQTRSILDLVGTADKAAIIKKVQDGVKNAEKGKWILGRGWDQNDWPVKE
ncbi:amidohydrolase family protein, partial [bacterium]|nr:amidohydrolase family protein [bacterium]